VISRCMAMLLNKDVPLSEVWLATKNYTPIL